MAASELYIGVDGGASRTRARIRDADGRSLGEGASGPANAWVDMGAAAANILAACREAAEQAGGLDLAGVHAGFGLAGAVRRQEQELVLAQPWPFASLVVDTDAYAAYLGACGNVDGAILIVGTGSCGLAVRGGDRANIGGWGSVVSDDGSGGWIGREAVRRSLWALEGLTPMSPFADRMLVAFDHDPGQILAWSGTALPGDFAVFAPIAFKHAGDRDPLATAIVTEAAAAIARMMDGLLALGAERVTLVGGLAGPIAPWLPPPLRDRLMPALADAVDGAILMARKARVSASS